MVEEMNSLDKNETWDLVEFLVGIKCVGRKWLSKKTFNAEEKVEKYKSRLVEKRYCQVEGIDFGENFSPTAKLSSIIMKLFYLLFFLLILK
jgi:hypothetical protein